MPLPIALVAGQLGLSALSGLTKGLGGKRVGLTGRRRRRRRLTNSEIAELTMLRNLFGKTAVAQLLPIYMRRGG